MMQRNPVEAVNDLGENRVQVYEGAFAIVRPLMQQGKVRVIAVTSTKPDPTYPNLPTAAQAQVKLFTPSVHAPPLRQGFGAQSLMFTQPVGPLPLYPAGQAPQLKLPAVLVQVVSGSQPPLLVAHSLTSLQPVVPVPV